MKVRLKPEIHEFMAIEASEAGESLSEYLAVGGFARAMFSFQRRNPHAEPIWGRVYSAARDTLRIAGPWRNH